MLRAAVKSTDERDPGTAAVDRVLLHPVAGLVVLLVLLFVMFQAVFAWARPLMDLIQDGFTWLGTMVEASPLPDLLKSFFKDGLISGVGSVIVFLPQIVILFFFILVLEDLGLHGPRGLPDGPHHGRRRPARARLHPAAVVASPAPSPASCRRA